ncbi:MAG: AAA family ATPase [Thermosynechococcaceae cyanobacterium MS004]|nr:AAA family ATPase [Thermosynechococcaceae cyanobacterium MS004]
MGALPALIQQMLQPAFYPHPVQPPVQLLQTHISYILLTGDFAYKVKKHVSFGFLDFTTLEKRHYFCQEELRLNQRLSPSLYLAVKAIGQKEGHFCWADKSQPVDVVEYAVQMRQFAQDGLFSHLFQSGQLTPELMQELGKLVAEFHAIADTTPEIRDFGSRIAIQRVDESNYGISVPYIGRSQTQRQYDETRAFTTQFFEQHAGWFEARQLDDKIRECHGDLHLNNVCLVRDKNLEPDKNLEKIQIFDCIEFNQDFRNIDVIYDVAFMVMDLEFQGRADLANVFLNTYLEQTGDYWGAVLLPLYLSMRASIRGNVNALALDDPAIADTEKAIFQQRSQDYYHLAWRYTQRQPGYLVMMSGLSGSGKSTVARQLAPALNAIHIRSDAVRKHLCGISLRSRGDQGGAVNSGIYTPEMTQMTYARVLELGIFLAQQGWPVILDAKYDRQSLRETAIATAEATHLPLHIVQCTAPIAVLKDRLERRTGDVADATADLLTSQLQTAEPLTEQEQAIAFILHTEQDLEPQLSAFLSKCREGNKS